jgi:galactokinase
MSLLLEQLLDSGFSEADARSRAALIVSVEEAFKARIGQPPRWRFWVPGRVEFFGKHTDYAGGRSLIAAVPRGFAVAAAARSDHLVRVIDTRRNVEAAIDALDHTRTDHGWTTYAATVVRRLAVNFPGARLGTDVVVASDLPSAAGLSSSSALIVGLALALKERAGLEKRTEWARHIPGATALAGYLGALEAGASFGDFQGASGVGTHGGSEDHTAILTGRAGMLSAYRYVPVCHLGDVAMPIAWSPVIATSGVHADKIGSARGRFNRASAAARALLDVWEQTSGRPATSLAAALASAPDARARLASVISVTSVPEFSGDDLQRRLEHFVREDARVDTAVRAFEDADAAGLGTLSQASQADAETLLGNQVPETIDLVAAAREAGALAATSFGAGFGGSAWAIVAAEDVGRFGPAWVARYRARRPHVSGVEWLEARPSPSAREIARDGDG